MKWINWIIILFAAALSFTNESWFRFFVILGLGILIFTISDAYYRIHSELIRIYSLLNDKFDLTENYLNQNQ